LRSLVHVNHSQNLLGGIAARAGCFLLTGVSVGAGDQKSEDKKIERKKKDGPKTNSRFQAKPIELNLKDGKVSYPGDLTDKDAAFQKHHSKVFTVNLEKGKTYRIDHKDRGDDPQFDALLLLEDADGNQLDANDDFNPPILDSRIVYKIAKTGAYRLVATTLPPGQTGKFTLEIAPETDAKLLKEADLKYRINSFASLSGAQRKNLIQQLSKRFKDQGEDLTIADAQLAFLFSIEAEMEEVDLARDILKDYSKMFGAASNKQVASISRQFDASLKNLDKIGKVLEIAGKTTAGKDFDLKNLKGKVVLVDFWGTWCGPCVAEVPNMVKAYEKYHKRGFDIIGISSDKDDDVVIAFMEGRQLPWQCINVEDGKKLIEANSVNSFPTPILVDQAGRAVSLRARGPQLERLLDRLLAEKK
jgi:thiol-disulfide isomerase/thioredoxin